MGSQFSVALADENGAEATAGVGNFDTVAAIGDGSIANAEGGNFDSAFALGAGSDVFAGGINSATHTLTTEGDNDLALAGRQPGSRHRGRDAGNDCQRLQRRINSR